MKIRNVVTKLGTKVSAVSVAFSIAMSSVAVRADESVSNFFDDVEGDNDMFGGVTQLVKQGGASLRSLITAIGVVFLIISISLAALGLTKKNVTDREQSKQRLVYLIIGAIIFFGSLALLIFSQRISGSITQAINDNMGG